MRRYGFVVVGIVAVATWLYYSSSSAQRTAPRPITSEVTRGDVVLRVDATGTVEAVTTVQVGTQVSGTIASLHADFNSTVRKGQVVARLEPSLFQTQVDQAQATVGRLQAEVERARVDVEDTSRKLHRAQELFTRALISENDRETAAAAAAQAQAALRSVEAQLVQATAGLRQAQVNLAHTIITAPIDGVVISRNVDVGQTVAASMQAPTLFVIARDLTRMQVRASVNEADIGGIASGQPATFRVDAYPQATFAGRVSQVRLQPTVEQNVVSYTTVIDVPNPDLRLKPGMTANVTIELARCDGVLRVPASALRFRPTAEVLATFRQTERADAPVATVGRDTDRPNPLAHVWVIRHSALERVTVTPGLSDGTTVAVASGPLEEGDVVITGSTAVDAGANSQAPSTSPLLPAGRRGGGAAARPPGTGVTR